MRNRLLVICPTPIGNLEDVSLRQRQALGDADIIACEDTRRAGKLLEMLGIERVDGCPKLWRYDDHTAQDQCEALVQALQRGLNVVLISDAGTPTISDPGYRLVRACRQASLEVTALPGPVAAVVALSGSGLASDRFFFEGFLPTKAGERHRRLQELAGLGVTVVAYESPRRIVETLKDVQKVCGQSREVCVARELTKRYEEYVVGTVAEVYERLAERDAVRGEVVLCIGGASKEAEDDDRWGKVDQTIEVLYAQGMGARSIKEVVSELFDVPRSQIYARIESVTGKK